MLIYTIRCKNNDFVIYVGSTSSTLSNRWGTHRRDCLKCDSYIYRYIRENGGIENFYIELLEHFEGTKEEMRKREGELIREFKTKPEYIVLNHNIAGRDAKEYYQQNIDTKLEYQKEYYQQNTDKRLEYQREYDKQNADKIKEQRRQNRLRKKAEKEQVDDI